jgi:hypothetical protein
VNVIFVEPAFPHYQREFVRALHAVGARVIGIGERPLAALGSELQHWLAHYEQVRSVIDEPALLEAVRRVQRRVWVDRLEATVEAQILPVARVREAAGIPGTSVRTAWLCRDKPSMKQALRAALPANGLGATPDESGSIAIEEFIEGHEGFLDTICVDGEVRREFISHYYPNVLEAMRERWISPQIVATNRIEPRRTSSTSIASGQWPSCPGAASARLPVATPAA